MMEAIWSEYWWAIILLVILVAGGGITWSRKRD